MAPWEHTSKGEEDADGHLPEEWRSVSLAGSWRSDLGEDSRLGTCLTETC